MTNTKENETKLKTPAQNSYRVKKTVILALICAMAYAVVLVCRLPIIPAAPYLDLEFKSGIILVGAYIFGPLSGLVMSVVICLLEMVTVSDTGVIGCIMNVLASICLVCPAAFIYKKRKTTAGAVTGIIVGAILMTVAMVLWNYILTPIYQGIPREAIVQMLLPVFVPFNLLKAGLNGGLALFIYRFALEALQKSNLIPKQQLNEKSKKGAVAGTVAVSVIIIATCVLTILAINGAF